MFAKSLLMMGLSIVAISATDALAADEMSVQVKTTQVRDRDSYLGKSLYELHFGDRVLILQKGAAWFKIQPVNTTDIHGATDAAQQAQNFVGYLNKSALTTKRVVLKADQNAQTAASSEDVALAGKGFNDDVEKSYQAQHPNLASAYATLNTIETNAAYAPTPEEINAFRAEGGLGGGESS